MDEQTIFNERVEWDHKNRKSESDLEIYEVKEKCCFCPYFGTKADLCEHIANDCEILSYEKRDLATDVGFGGQEDAEGVLDLDEHNFSEESTGIISEVLKDKFDVDMENIDVDALDVEMEPDDVGQFVGKVDATAAEEKGENLVFDKNVEFASSIDFKNKTKSRDSDKQVRAGLDEERGEFLQFARSLWSRLNGDKMAVLIETKVVDICTRISTTLKDVIKHRVDETAEDKCHVDKKSVTKADEVKAKLIPKLLYTELDEGFVEEVFDNSEEPEVFNKELAEEDSEVLEIAEEKSYVKPAGAKDVDFENKNAKNNLETKSNKTRQSFLILKHWMEIWCVHAMKTLLMVTEDDNTSLDQVHLNSDVNGNESKVSDSEPEINVNLDQNIPEMLWLNSVPEVDENSDDNPEMLLDPNNIEIMIDQTMPEDPDDDTVIINEDRRRRKASKTKQEQKVGHAETENKVAKETQVAGLKPFLYSAEGLIRLIKLDLGITEEHESGSDMNSIEERMACNIWAEEQHDPPSKRIPTNPTYKEEGKEEEMGRVPRVASEVQENTSEVEDRKEDFESERKHGQAEEKKKVMGMCDSHIVTDYVYHLT